MGLYKFDESEFTVDYWNNISKIVGSRKNGMVCFVDVEEAELELNRKKGITKPGWWYIEKVVRGDLVKYRVIPLALMNSHKIKNRLVLNSGENSITEDDTLVVDGDYDIYPRIESFNGDPHITIWRRGTEQYFLPHSNQIVTLYLSLVNHGDPKTPDGNFLSSIKNNGVYVSINTVGWYFDFQVREVPKDGSNNSAPWKSVRTLDGLFINPDVLSYMHFNNDSVATRNIFIEEIIKQQEYKVNDYYYRYVVKNNIGSEDGVSGEMEFRTAESSIDYDLTVPYKIQSGDPVNTGVNYDLYMYENGSSTFDVDLWQRRINGSAHIDMVYPHVNITGNRTAKGDRTSVSSGTLTFSFPDNSQFFKVENDGLHYELTVVDNDSPEQWSNGVYELEVIKRKGHFKKSLSPSYKMAVTDDPTTHLLFLDIDVVNDIYRDQSIGGTNGLYDLILKWEYKYTATGEEERDWQEWNDRLLVNLDNTDAINAVGQDLTKAAIDADRPNGQIKVKVTAQAGNNLDETEPVSTVTTIDLEHQFPIVRELADIYNKSSITSIRTAITNVVCAVGYGNPICFWEVSVDNTQWVLVNNVGADRVEEVTVENQTSPVSVLSLSVEDIDNMFSGDPTTVYVRARIQGATYITEVRSDPITFSVDRG